MRLIKTRSSLAFCIGIVGITVGGCGDGSDGTPGSNGADVTVRTTVEPAGKNCANGGRKVEFGTDTDHDGTLWIPR